MADSSWPLAATEPVAVVGLACRFPDADDPPMLLDTILTGRRAFRRLPPGRLAPGSVGSAGNQGGAGSPGGPAGDGTAADRAARDPAARDWAARDRAARHEAARDSADRDG